MEKNRSRAKRRYSDRVIQNRRYNLYWIKDCWPPDSEDFPRRFGKLKSNHMGCGCPICKSWKYQHNSFKPSDCRNLNNMLDQIQDYFLGEL